MDNTIDKVVELLPDNISYFLSDVTPADVAYLLRKAKSAIGVKDSVLLEDALQSIQAVLDFSWERLNIGHWKEVPVHQHQLFTLASHVKIVLLLQSCIGSNDVTVIREALRVADLGLIIGAPLSSGSNAGDLRQVANILTLALNELYCPLNTSKSSSDEIDNENITFSFGNDNGKWKEVTTLHCPSLETFFANYFTPQLPVKLSGCMDHWPAVRLWRNMKYLMEQAGPRMVPVEIGAHYVDPAWCQDFMTLSEFINNHVLGTADRVGYLAQHRLFDQIPELRADIYEPEYCCLGDDEGEDTEINAWFGPQGTVSPLHFDPKNNLLCQVVGSKRVLLYAPQESSYLYPHVQNPITNTARVDPEQPDCNSYPEFHNAHGWECYLKPGEMLYIPPQWWHHVRSLSTSFSVSFWWK